MKYTVKSPVAGYTGQVAGVDLVKGSYTGELTPSALAYFRRQGYSVEAVKAPAKPPATEGKKPSRPSKAASKAEWVTYATTHGGMTEADADALSRDALAEKFADPAE